MIWSSNSIITYILIFFSLYFEVFLLITFFENFRKTKNEEKKIITRYPTVTVVVPAFNEEKTVAKTIETLLKLDYPKDKLKITVVDDGSKDGTWQEMQKYKNHPQVEIFHKENGGKFTALNFAITHSKSEVIGCLDADSFVEPGALKSIVSYFEESEAMAVTPAVKIHKPNNILRHLQRNEYNMGVFNKKVLGQLEAINVTPGPFSFFRREVFEKIGLFKHAHNTEDMEIAMRMQKHGLKIRNAHRACVYTVGPATFKGLYKQRLRWMYGYLRNLLDYKEMILTRKYGNLGLFFLPISFLMVFGAVYYSGLVMYNVVDSIITRVIRYNSVGFYWTWPRFDWFFVNTSGLVFLAIILVSLSLITIAIGSKISDDRWGLNLHSLYFPFIFPVISLVWLLKAIWNIINKKKTPNWR
jgi:cellulose synthase/poly-beta-1,6-N-acetylglucosamine synthase-like glycosyltransferase